MYHQITQGIRVTVMPVYIDERSDPEQNRYFWAYRVVIFNDGKRSIQVVSRHWIITDANGRTEEVRGRGVVGEQPILRPGDSFEYTSGCPLTTSSGFMRGTYTVVDEGGEEFKIAIPLFPLDLPDAKPVLN
jgi:ApaG protein